MKNWYAVYTKPQCEQKVAHLLAKKGIESYCPLNLIEKEWWAKKKLVYEPLFSSMVFVKMRQEDLLNVRNTKDVINFFYWLQKPVVINQFEIDYIKIILRNHSKVTIEKVPICMNNNLNNENAENFKQNKFDTIQLENGKSKVLLPSLGFTLITELNSIFKSQAIVEMA